MGGRWVFLGYLFAYGTASLGTVVALPRALRIEDHETRYGLVGLLVGSGGWAVTELAFLVLESPAASYAAYQVSLIIGLTTVGAWLYFCSAYTGRTFHRNRTYRRAAVGVYLAIVAVKLTNPLHGLYFTTEAVTVPFPHLTIQHGTLHWVVTGLSYALVAVGFFMLYELFLEADYDARPLAGVVGVTALPVVLDVFGFATPWVIDINYEPLGVAVFAIATLYVFEDRFLAVQLTDGVEDAVVYLDANDRIQEANGQARELFPELTTAVGEPLEDALPEVAAKLEADTDVLERTRDGETRYYLVNDTAFALGQTDLRRLVVFTDVTDTERQRREIERHNEQLEAFAAAIRHELLNTLNIISGRVDLVGEALDEGDVQRARETLQPVDATADRMETLVQEFADLARYGQTVETTRAVDVAETARAAFDATETGDLALTVEGDGELEADPDRLRRLFENAFVFATRNGATAVTVRIRSNGFTIRDDGRPPGDDDPDAYFAYGEAVPDATAGMALPNLRMFAENHGWETTIDTGYDDGVKVVVSGARLRQRQVA